MPYILLIDDDKDDCEMLSSSLALLGVKTRTYNSCEKAIFYLKLISDTSEFPSLIVLDYNIPRMNGREILRSIKANPSTNKIPVIIYSTSLPLRIRKDLLDLGALACYSKPFSNLEFEAQVDKFRAIASSMQLVGDRN